MGALVQTGTWLSLKALNNLTRLLILTLKQITCFFSLVPLVSTPGHGGLSNYCTLHLAKYSSKKTTQIPFRVTLEQTSCEKCGLLLLLLLRG